MNNCIYLYADILGYKDLLNTKSVNQIKNIMQGVLGDIDKLLKKRVKESEKANVVNKSEFQKLFKDWSKTFYAFETGKLKFYFAFDTIVIYWSELSDENNFFQEHQELFLNLISTVYLILFVKFSILIRGTISKTKNYYIDDRIFIIKDIEKSYLIEKYQNWSGIVISHADLINIPGIGTIDNDPYCVLNINKVPFKKVDGMEFNEALENEQFPLNNDDIMPFYYKYDLMGKDVLILNPINNFTVNFMKDLKIYEKFIKKINNKDLLKDKLTENVKVKLENTYNFLKERHSIYKESKDPNSFRNKLLKLI